MKYILLLPSALRVRHLLYADGRSFAATRRPPQRRTFSTYAFCLKTKGFVSYGSDNRYRYCCAFATKTLVDLQIECLAGATKSSEPAHQEHYIFKFPTGMVHYHYEFLLIKRAK